MSCVVRVIFAYEYMLPSSLSLLFLFLTVVLFVECVFQPIARLFKV